MPSRRNIVAAFALAAALTSLQAAQTNAGRMDATSIRPPVAVYKVSPKHPPALYEKAIEGRASVIVTIDVSGHVIDTVVDQATHDAFGLAAAEAASKWVFEPATEKGAKVKALARLPFVFEITYEHKVNVEMGREIFVEIDDPVISSSRLAQDPLPDFVPPFSKFYPESLKGSGKSASVSLEYVVSPSGDVINPRILSISSPGFEDAAIRAVSSMKYKPILIDGKAAYVSMRRPIQISE